MAKIRIPHNYEPRPYQLPLCKAIDNGFKRAVSVWHRRAGKDKTLINIMVKEMFKRIGTYFYFFPTFKQGRMVIWNGMDMDGFPFMNHIPEEIRSRTSHQEMSIKLKNGSIFQIVGTDDIDRVVGTNPVGCVFSEYALQKPEAWEFIKPILRQNKGWALFNYTPRGLNHGWDIYQRALKQEDWFCELLTIKDTKALIETDIEAERADGMSENLINQEYYCDFMASADDVLISMDLILGASGKVIAKKDYHLAPKVIGVDVARFGDDKSVLIKRQGLAAFDLVKFDNIDNMTLASKVAQEINLYNPDAVFIDAGRGEGVIDRLRQLDYNVIEVNFGGKATQDSRYFNKRAEMWDGCRKWLEAGGAIPDDIDLRTELSLVTYSFDPRERIKLLSKDKMKENGLSSPDCGDALVLTFAEHVPVKADISIMARYNTKAQTEYNLFGG